MVLVIVDTKYRDSWKESKRDAIEIGNQEKKQRKFKPSLATSLVKVKVMFHLLN